MMLSDAAAAPMSRQELCDYLQVTSSKLHDVLRKTDLSVTARTYPWRRVCSEVLGLQPFVLRSWHDAAKEQIGSEVLRAVTDIELKLREPLVTFDQMSRSLGCLPDTLSKALRQGRLCLPFTVLSFGERTRRYFPLEVCAWRDEGIAINLPVSLSIGPRRHGQNAYDDHMPKILTPQKAIFGGFGAHKRKQNR